MLFKKLVQLPVKDLALLPIAPIGGDIASLSGIGFQVKQLEIVRNRTVSFAPNSLMAGKGSVRRALARPSGSAPF